jgi:hypothetical protein
MLYCGARLPLWLAACPELFVHSSLICFTITITDLIITSRSSCYEKRYER